MALWFSKFVIKQLPWPIWLTNQFVKKLAMLLLPGIVLAMILALESQCVSGIQCIVHVSESVSCDDNFSYNGSGEGDNGSVCCVYGNCTCCSLDHALAKLTSNVLINITTDVMLSSLIERSDLENISIIGHNNPTVILKNDGGVHFTSCYNCIIEGIIWDGCSTDNIHNQTEPGLMLKESSNVAIQNCLFQCFLEQALVLSEVSGEVNINNCNFVNNSHYRGHGAAIHYSSNDTIDSHFVFNITNCSFSYNKGAKSFIYIETSIDHNDVTFTDSIFHDNDGVCIFLVNQKLYIMGNTLFESNAGKQGTGMYISDNSRVVFGENSNTTFINNSADTSGGVIFLTDHSNLSFDQNSNTTFINNSADDSGGAIFLTDHSNLSFDQNSYAKFSSNSATNYGAAIYSFDNSHIIFKGNSNVIFNNNGPGAITSYYDHYYYYAHLHGIIHIEKHAYIIFEGYATTVFSDNTADYGGAIYCNDNSYVSFEGNSTTEFIDNTADRGGAIHCNDNSYVSFEGNSTTEFIDNTADIGGAIHCNDNSYVSFEGNSTTEFIDNTANYGGAIFCDYNSYISFHGISAITFNNNIANYYGGAIISLYYSCTSFKEHSTTVFSNNIAARHGAAVASAFDSEITFDDKSVIMFTNNKATDNTTVYSGFNSKIMARGDSSVVFNDVSAKWCNNVCLQYTGNYPDIIAIDSNGIILCSHPEGFICQLNNRKCNCSEFNRYFRNNSVINITDTVILSSTVSFKNLSNISIIGDNNPFVYCVNGSGLTLLHSKNVVVKGITWIGCGKAFDSPLSSEQTSVPINSVIHLQFSLSVLIQNCSFLYSDGPAIVLSEVSGEMNVTHCKFVNSSSYSDHGAAIHYTINDKANSSLTISDCSFAYNKFAKSVVYIENRIYMQNHKIIIQNSNFHHNQVVSIHVVNQKLTLSGNISFWNNNAREGSGIYITDSSVAIFGDNSKVSFIQNAADNGGGSIILLRNNSTVLFDQNCEVIFNENKATNGTIYSESSCNVVFKSTSRVTFSGNSATQYGAAISSFDNSQVKFTGNSTTMFNHSIVHLHNKSKMLGGTVFCENNSNILFEGDSTTIFSTNTGNVGAAVLLFYNSEIILRKTSNLMINNNTARWNYGSQFTNKSNDIIIDDNGTVRCSDHTEYYVCQYKSCFCKSLNDIPSNSVVIITDNITLSSPIQLTELVNISLTGYNSPSVYCENDGGFQFTSCSNVSIANITWHKFSNNESTTNNITPQIKFYNSLNITIDNCIFQQSVGQAILLSEVSEYISIKHCKFVNNMHPHAKSQHGSAIHYSSSNDTESSEDQLIIIISDCYFTDNIGIASLVYLEQHNNGSQCKSIILQDSIFSNNQGTCIHLSNQNLYIQGHVLFENNEAENGAGIFISDNSNLIIDKSSNVTFAQNTATINGGAIYVNNWSSVVFENNALATFSSNKATESGGTVYSCNSSGILLKENSTVLLVYSNAELGGTFYAEKSSFIITKGRSNLTIINSEAMLGGASYLIQSNMTITENSTVAFLNNKAERDGGSVYSNSKSNITFKGNSTINITGNIATYGGAIYSTNGSNTEFENNSTTIFNSNEATENGGCIYITKQSNIYFKETSRVMFNNSVAFNGAGGAIFCAGNSKISFISCDVKFQRNTVYEDGGGAICCINSTAIFSGTSEVEFDGNQATNGGAADLNMNSNFIIKDNVIVTFSKNSATMGGAVNFHGNSNGTFEVNSTLVVRNNSALQNGGAFHLEMGSYIEFKQPFKAHFDANEAVLGGAIYCSENSSIIFTDLSNILLSNNSAERGGAIIFTASKILYKSNSSIIFKYNIASQDGGAIYIADHSRITFMQGSNVTFSHNKAKDYGGAIFYDKGIIDFTNSTVSFPHNSARIGSSVYINLPTQCNSTCLNNKVLGINTTHDNLVDHITTSPSKIELYSSNIHLVNNQDLEYNSYYIHNIMLGQKILLDACMYDYYGHPVYVAWFIISGTNNQNYHLDSNNTLITCNHTIELASIYGKESAQFNYSINLSLYDNRQSESKEVMTNLTVGLSPCHPGFSYKSQKCECYNTSDIVLCSGSSSTIKRGYWFGNVSGKSTVTFCPINYCNFICCETSNGYYHLSPVRDNQCRLHRSGTACGNCTDGYTLSFDSTECVNINNCTAGHTVLVILLSIIYWIVMVTLVFALMHCKIEIGYLYGITYYYSIMDILLNQNLYASKGLYLTVIILSSFSKIIPQFLGELCLSAGLSGIDQQFIHYIHPLAIIVILGIISLLARISLRVSVFISRGIIHVICLLLLLSYTSVTSTSLLLMRSLSFHEIDKVYTYLSPDMEYFHGRHLIYGIVALLCTVSIAIGLPLLLTLEPFLNRKINFTKIKPLLDQFQGCYKDKYRYFAGYYMICRLVIITIVIVNSSNDFVANYLLIIACGIIALIHLLIKPYNSGILNKLDGVILQLIIFTEALTLFDDHDSLLVITFSFVLVILPLLIIISIAIFLHKDDIKKLFIFFAAKITSRAPNSNDVTNTDIPMKEYNLVIGNTLRANATICDM